MSVDTLLSRLSGVRKTGSDRWSARCPSHDDKHNSLSVRELDDGRVLVHCFAECAVEEVLGAVGLEFDALFPERAIDADNPSPRERYPFLPTDVFEIARLEAAVVAVIACDMNKSRTISETDYQRLGLAISKLECIAQLAYGF